MGTIYSFLETILYFIISGFDSEVGSIIYIFIFGCIVGLSLWIHSGKMDLKLIQGLLDIVKGIICFGSALLSYAASAFYFFTDAPSGSDFSGQLFFIQFSVLFTQSIGILGVLLGLYILWYVGVIEKIKQKRFITITMIILDLLVVGLFFINQR